MAQSRSINRGLIRLLADCSSPVYALDHQRTIVYCNLQFASVANLTLANEWRAGRPKLLHHFPSRDKRRRSAMTLCPIAIVAGCKKCPAFSICPLKSIVGDYRKEKESTTAEQSADDEQEQELAD